MFGAGPVLLALQQKVAPEMTAGGWVFMIAAWAFILVLTVYTFGKILRRK